MFYNKNWKKDNKKYNHIGPTIDKYLNFINNSRQPKYPKNYDECCEVIGNNIFGTTIIDYKSNILITLKQLLVCRDAYWKIAGEQMDLNKAWKPDLQNKKEEKYAIINIDDTVVFVTYIEVNSILLFPTEEIRNIFYENFKDLIEQCKELL